MRKGAYSALLPAAILAVSILAASCNTDADLKRLDREIGRREDIRLAFEHRTDSLRRSLEAAAGAQSRRSAAAALFEAYKRYDIDSADRYAVMMEELSDSPYEAVEAVSARCIVMGARREYDRADALMSAVDTSALDEAGMLVLLDARQAWCNSYNNELSLDREERKRYTRLRREYLCRMASSGCQSPFQQLYTEGKVLYYDGKYREAISRIQAAIGVGAPIKDLLHATYAIANCYSALGMKDSCEVMLCRTAMLDLNVPSRQYRSLYDLALSRHRCGDYSRAERYIQIALTDALACNYDTRIVNAAEAQIIINTAREHYERQRVYLLGALVLFLLADVAVVTGFLVKVNRQRRRLKTLFQSLKTLNRDLSDKNREIREANIIKEKYLFRYMLLSAGFLNNVDDYRKQLRHILKEDGPEALAGKLRHPDEAYLRKDSFYHSFDEIFLGIFPDFVDQVNSLLRPECRFSLKDEATLPTELRILAVIRLGMDKSSRIADFLDCSANTVYAYRTRMRYGAMEDPDGFEDKIKKIGIK